MWRSFFVTHDEVDASDVAPDSVSADWFGWGAPFKMRVLLR
jgi:hypothetical protein